MMRILILIFLICHVNFINCIDLPKFLKCVDDSCDEQISTGRIIKPSNPIHGNLKLLKALSKVIIKGKNDTPENTLWLIEKDGEYGFLDLSFIKENINDVKTELMSVRNPHYKKTTDETEDDEDSTNETSIFSKGKSTKTNDISVENDETENFSEGNHNLKEETGKSRNIISETDKISSTHKDSDSLKNDSDNTNPNLINNQSKSVNGLKSQIDKINNDPKQEVQQSIDPINTLKSKENENTETSKNIVQEEKQLTESNENTKLEIQKDKNMNNLNLLNQNIKDEGTKESKQDSLQNKSFDLNNRKGIDETSVNKKEENVSENVQTSKIPSKTTETQADIQENPKLTDKSAESEKNNNPTSNEKLENVKPDEPKNSISINPEKSVEKSEKKDMKTIESPVENVNENKVEMKHGSSNNLQNTKEKSFNSAENNIEKGKIDETNKKLIKNSTEEDGSKNNNKEIENSKPDDKTVGNSNNFTKNSEHIPKELNKSINRDSQSDLSVHSKPDEKLTNETIEKNNNFINQENISKSDKNDEKLQEKSENVKIELDFIEKHLKGEPTEKINNANEEVKKNNEIDEQSKILAGKTDETSENLKNPDKKPPIKESSENQPMKSDPLIPNNEKKQEEILAGKTDETSENLKNPDKKPPIKESSENQPMKSDPLIPNNEKKQEEILAVKIDETSEKLKNPDKKPQIEESSENQPIKSDPWFLNNEKKPEEILTDFRSPVIKLMVKLDHIVSQVIIKSIIVKFGFDSSSRSRQFTNYWFQMSLENFVSIFLLFSVVFLIVYSPKLFGFNRDWKSEFIKQNQSIKELESKLQNIEEVRHKLSVQNHNFEKVIDEYKEKNNEIKEDAVKNKNVLLLEVDKIKKTDESIIKKLKSDLKDEIEKSAKFESEIDKKTGTIDKLQEEKKQLEILIENEKSKFENRLSENQIELERISGENEQIKRIMEDLSREKVSLRDKNDELNQKLIDKNVEYSHLENSIEQMKLFEGLDSEEFNEKKSILLELIETKQELESAKGNIDRLNEELKKKLDLIDKLEENLSEIKREMIDNDKRKSEAVAEKEAAEMKLNFLSEYFKSKEVEMAKTLGHQVIESTQSMDQVDCLKHRIGILETDNQEMLKIIQKLKSEVKDSQIFAAKCKSDANEEINKLFLKCSNLERSLLSETDENKKLRIKLSRYCGPTPPRNNQISSSTLINHNSKDRPPSRQSGGGGGGGSFIDSSSYTFSPLPFIPFTPQSPTIPNNSNTSQFSGRNSVNSKKSNNT